MREIPGTGLIPVASSRPVVVASGAVAATRAGGSTGVRSGTSLPVRGAADSAAPVAPDAVVRPGARGHLLDIVV